MAGVCSSGGGNCPCTEENLGPLVDPWSTCSAGVRCAKFLTHGTRGNTAFDRIIREIQHPAEFNSYCQMDAKGASECLKAQAALIARLVRTYVPQQDKWSDAVELIEAAMVSRCAYLLLARGRTNRKQQIVQGMVHLVHGVPPLLIAVDLFWHSEDSAWPDWQRITQWQNEDLSHHPWSQWPEVTGVAASEDEGSSSGIRQQGACPIKIEVEDVELEDGLNEEDLGERARQWRERGKRKADYVSDDPCGQSLRCHLVKLAAGHQSPAMPSPGDKDGGGSGFMPGAAEMASNLPETFGNQAPPAAPPTQSTPAAPPTSPATCATCNANREACVPNPSNPTGACKGCHQWKKRCSLLNKSHGHAAYCRQSTVHPPAR